MQFFRGEGGGGLLKPAAPYFLNRKTYPPQKMCASLKICAGLCRFVPFCASVPFFFWPTVARPQILYCDIMSMNAPAAAASGVANDADEEGGA
jgi:hypothetical protein